MFNDPRSNNGSPSGMQIWLVSSDHEKQKWINSARLGIRNNLELMSKITVNNDYDPNKR